LQGDEDIGIEIVYDEDATRIKSITHGAVLIIGTKIAILGWSERKRKYNYSKTAAI
jgi:hypothetical protein